MDDVMLKVGTRVLLERPSLMALFGLITANWSQLEEHIALFYAYLLGQHGPSQRYGQPVDPMGVHIFFELASWHQRKKLLSLMIGTRLPAESLKIFNSMVVKTVETAAKHRNGLVHTRLAVSDQYPDALVAVPLIGDMRVIMQSNLDEAIERIEQARQAVMEFEHDARQLLNC
jgi:hypothetical protein